MSELFSLFPHESGIVMQRGIEIGIFFSTILISHCLVVLHSRTSRTSPHPLMDLGFEILLLARLVCSIPRPYMWVTTRRKFIDAQMQPTPQLVTQALLQIYETQNLFEKFLLYFYYGWLIITGVLSLVTPYRTEFSVAVWRHVLLNLGCIILHRILCIVIFYYLVNADIPRGLHQSVLENETLVFNFGGPPVDNNRVSTECSICYGDYVELEEVRVLKCGHNYHKDCIDEWLTRHRNRCPMCMHVVGSK